MHFVESMPRIIRAVLRVKGGQTLYYQGVPNKVSGACICLCKNKYINTQQTHEHIEHIVTYWNSNHQTDLHPRHQSMLVMKNEIRIKG